MIQGTLPAVIHQHLPNRYVLETECVYIEPIDFLVFIKHSNEVYVFNLYKRHLEYELPIDLPSATTVKCRVLATCRKSIEEGKYFTSKTTAHSKQIDFKTCKYVNQLRYKFERIRISTNSKFRQQKLTDDLISQIDEVDTILKPQVITGRNSKEKHPVASKVICKCPVLCMYHPPCESTLSETVQLRPCSH